MVFSKDDKERWTHPGSVYPSTDEAYIRELETYIKEIHEPFGGVEASDAQFAKYQQAAKLLNEAIPALRDKDTRTSTWVLNGRKRKLNSGRHP